MLLDAFKMISDLAAAVRDPPEMIAITSPRFLAIVTIAELFRLGFDGGDTNQFDYDRLLSPRFRNKCTGDVC